MDFLQKFKEDFNEFFKNVDSSTKVITFLFLIVFVIAVGTAVYFNRKPSFGLLYNNLSESTAAQIVKHLDDNNIEYNLKSGGRNVYVHKNRVNEIRLLMKGKGLPKDGESVGYEIFDKNTLGVTEFVQNIQNKRALEGELERTIINIKGVEAARVHVVIPKDRLFEEDKTETTATIMLNLSYEGAADSKVNTIRHLVGAAVEGLKPNAITIVDNFGNTLAAQEDDENLSGFLTSRMSVQKRVEKYYKNKVQSLFDSVLGKKGAVVRVDAFLNFDKVEETEEKFDPESAVVRAEVITSENTKGLTNSSKGAPGVQSNTKPGAASANASKQENNSNREVINNKYEIDKKIKHIIKGVGDIKRLSISVFLKENVKKDKDGNDEKDKDGNFVTTPRTEDEIRVFEDIVKNAIGFSDDRGDSIVIKELRFEKQSNIESMDFPKSNKLLGADVNTWVNQGVKFGSLFILIMLLSSILKKNAKSVIVSDEVPVAIKKKKKKVSMNATQEEIDNSEMEAMRNEGMKMVEKGAFVAGEISQLVDKFPSETEHILKKWLKQAPVSEE